ncbi:serine/threonine protein kinase [Streptomyces phaeoluteigriseus]|uniref:Serine/threonine protein kinase n=1 Tax=Streptomyces phaeoluteigriseus TaxID=114686 RepID=A0A1V6MRL5_9ACTN|nr:serine/threonine-protein kinase [Streptomyces phaeoluteigriseus]OQD54946.1 serine/threonine protein kinase [Streptomyces phaeoluteigriseus]
MTGVQQGGHFRPLESGDPTSVASYRLAARLGAGGMGTVYLSYTPGGHPIALKTIRPELSEDPEFRRRFRQEVQAAQRVQGLYTAPVIDYDTEDAHPWLATAYVAGPSLAAAVGEHGPLPVPSVLLLLAGMAEALSVIHGAGIVHRDLKPSNVLLASDGPRVIDFGIARAADATALTGTGVSIGTPAFMSPEQAAGKKVTPASDVFALGQVAAFAARGTGAYGDGPSHAVLYRIVHEEPDLSGLAEQLGFIARCLAKDPAERPSPAEIITLCQEASPTPLRQSGSWLPEAIAAQITQRVSASAALAAGPAPTAPVTQPDLSPPRQAPAQTPAHAAPTAAATHLPPTPSFGPVVPPPHPQAPYQPSYGPPTVPPPFPHQQHAHPQPAWRPLPPPKKNQAGKWIGISIAAVMGLSWLGGCASFIKELGDSSDASATSGATGGGTGSAASAGPLPDPQPVTYKGINIPESYSVRFADSPPKPVEAPDGSSPRYESDSDLYYYDAGGWDNDPLLGSSGEKVVLLNNAQKGSLATCRAETRYTKEVQLSQVSKGSQLCVHSSSGHIALVTFKGSAPENDPSDYVTVDVTVWRNAEDPSSEE